MEEDFVVEDTAELRDYRGQLDSLRLMFLEGVARRLGEETTLKEAIAFFRDPGPPPPKRRPRKKR